MAALYDNQKNQYLAKAEYLFNHQTDLRQGGDKQKIWRTVLGFESPEAIREAISSKVVIDQLEPQSPNQYGDRYQATILIEAPSGISWLVRTGWIVLVGEDIARFVTAFPERLGRQQ